MSNGKTLKEQMSYVRAQNEAQNEKLDNISKKLDEHEHSSNLYREQQATNTEAIKNIKKESLPAIRKLIFGGYGLAGSAILLFIGALVKYIWFTR